MKNNIEEPQTFVPSITAFKATIQGLTEKERRLFNAAINGMDALGCGWFHELAARADMEDNHSTAGVLGSLVKKGLVTSFRDEGCDWVTLTDEAGEASGLTKDEDGDWAAAA